MTSARQSNDLRVIDDFGKSFELDREKRLVPHSPDDERRNSDSF